MPLKDWRGSLTTFDGFTGTRPVAEWNNVGWKEVSNLLCPEKPAMLADKGRGQYFVPCALKEAPLVGNTLEYATQSGAPTIGRMRSKQHMTEAAMLVVDVDGLSAESFHAGLTALARDGLTYLAYTTHSHGSLEKPGMRVRIVVPLDRPLADHEYRLAWYGLNARYFGGAA